MQGPSVDTSEIDGVIDRVERIAIESVTTGDRIGYFAAMYLAVTRAVKAAIVRGEFDDPTRMSHFDQIGRASCRERV